MSTKSIAAAAAAIAAAVAFAAPAQAHTSWSVSIAGPGYTFGGGPVYYAAPYVYPHHHWHRAYVPAAAFYPAPVVVGPRVVYRAPVAYSTVVYPAPRVVYPAPVVVRRW